MKHLLSSLCLLISLTGTWAQTTLTGYVTLQNSGGKSAFPAQVKPVFGASATVVDSDNGYFKLEFDRKRPGQDVELEVLREGYEVVNRRDLYHRLPEAHEVQRPLKFYLCPIGQWQRYAAEYEGINLKGIERSYEERLAVLQRQLADKEIAVEEYRSATFQLAEDKKIAESQAQELAEKFAQANLDEATDRFVLAHRLFTEGKIDSVLLVLDEEKMKADLAAAEKDIREGIELIEIGKGKLLNGQEAKEKIVEEFMVKARAHILKLEWEKAELAFDVAVHADSLNADIWFEYAVFLQQQNQFNKAQPIYEHCLRLQENEAVMATTLNNLAVLFQLKNDFTGAEKIYLRALEIFERLAIDYPNSFDRHVANTYINIANLNKAINNFSKAEKAYLEALEIFERLDSKNPKTFEPDIAITLNNLAVLYKANNDFPLAEKACLNALVIYERLAKENPREYKPYLATALNNLSNLYKAKNDFPKAEKAYLLTLAIYENLYKENPRTFEPLVATALNNIAVLYSESNNFKGAEKAFLRALEIRERLALGNPRVYEPDVATTLNNLANLYKLNNDFSSAKKAYLRTLDIYESLAQETPKVFESSLAATLNNLAILYNDVNDSAASEKAYQKALEIFERLVIDNPQVHEPSLAITLITIGLCKAKNDFPSAEKAYLRALEIYSRLDKENPKIFEPEIATTLHNLGRLYFFYYDLKGAEDAYLQSLEIRERLAMENHLAQSIDLCKTYLSLAQICLARIQSPQKGNESRRRKGIEWLVKAAKALKVYPEDFEPRIQLTQAILHVANVLEQYDPGLSPYQERIAAQEAKLNGIAQDKDKVGAQQALIGIYEEAAKAHPESRSISQRLAVAYGALSWYALFAQDFSLAEQSARTAIATHESAEWVYTNLALALLYQGRYEAAHAIYAERKGKMYDEERSWVEVFLADLDALESEGITHPDVRKIRRFLQE